MASDVGCGGPFVYAAYGVFEIAIETLTAHRTLPLVRVRPAPLLESSDSPPVRFRTHLDNRPYYSPPPPAQGIHRLRDSHRLDWVQSHQKVSQPGPLLTSLLNKTHFFSIGDSPESQFLNITVHLMNGRNLESFHDLTNPIILFAFTIHHFDCI